MGPLATVHMAPSAWLAILASLGVFLTLLWRRDTPIDLLFLGGLVVVTASGVITPNEALMGFGNPAVITIGALFVVAAGLRSTGVLDFVGNRLLGTARTANSALRRLTFTVLGISPFVNNTPVVAMFVPVVLDWCRKRGVSPSRLLIPLSYLTILGGACTLIGTSTNILVGGLLREEYTVSQSEHRYSEAFRYELHDLSMFEIGKVGIPCAVVGALYLLLVGRRLLPDRAELVEQLGERSREYLVEMLVQPECRLVGKAVEEAGLRHLRGLFLIEIDRGDEVITPVAPHDIVRAGDRLVFTGVVSTIIDLVRIPGLVPANDTAHRLHPAQRRQRHLSEAVISKSSPLIGLSVRRANFRRLYHAAVVAVHRNGARLPSKVGDIVLEAGDTLLLQTRTEFATSFRNSRDFYLVASVEGSQPRRHDRAWLALGLLALLVVWLSAATWLATRYPGLGSPAVIALTIAGLYVATRCLPIAEARGAVDLQVLVTIGAALGLGRALTESGAAKTLAQLLVASVGDGHPMLLLTVIYIVTAAFTEIISNAAVAAMIFPLAVATAAASGYSPRPFVMAVMLAASLSFITPIGYQTNLMVMGPGGYQPRDYLKVGWPLSLLVALTALTLIPRMWPLAL